MKSVIFSFKQSGNKINRRPLLRLPDIKYFIRRYGKHMVFVLILLAGLAVGTVYARNADSQLLNSLDFLFTTNLDVRLEQNAAGTFCACFASDFIFLLAVFLCGFAPWGVIVLPLIVFFRGLGTGITAGYLISVYSLKGAGFYLLVLLPGTFVFCLALVIISVYSFGFSKRMFSFVISRSASAVAIYSDTIRYCSHSMSALIMTFCASLLDTALWTLFSGVFNF